jgi:hypothetical protein
MRRTKMETKIAEISVLLIVAFLSSIATIVALGFCIAAKDEIDMRKQRKTKKGDKK